MPSDVRDPEDDPPQFALDQMPESGWPGAPDRTFTMDCCTQEDCVQRDYNRAVLLTLEKMAETLAAFYLTRHHTREVWVCDDAGHSKDCPKPQCRFARDRDNDLSNVQFLLSSAVRAFCKALTFTNADLTPQWHEFYDVEQAFIGLSAEGEESLYLTVLREMAVGAFVNDPRYHRWFRPPAFRDPRGPARGPAA